MKNTDLSDSDSRTSQVAGVDNTNFSEIFCQTEKIEDAHRYHIAAETLLDLFSFQTVVDKLHAFSDSNNLDIEQMVIVSVTESNIEAFGKTACMSWHPKWRTRKRIQEKLIRSRVSALRRYAENLLISIMSVTCKKKDEHHNSSDQVLVVRQFLTTHVQYLRTHSRRRELFSFMLKLDMHEQILELVKSWHPSLFAGEQSFDDYLSPQAIILELKNPGDVNEQMRRLQLPLKNRYGCQEIRLWVNRTQSDGLDYVCDFILQEKSSREAQSMIREFGWAKVIDGMAVCMLQLSIDSKAPEEARAWLRKHPNETIQDLLPIASNGDRNAIAALKWLKNLSLKKGYAEKISSTIAQQPNDVAEELRAQLLEATPAVQKMALQFDKDTTPEWLHQALATLKHRRNQVHFPEWLPESVIPAILVGQASLTSQQNYLVIAALRKSKFDAPHPFVLAIKQHAEPVSTDQFVLTLLERWVLEDMPKNGSWVMQALAHLGGEASALKLGALILQWRKKSKWGRAGTGVKALGVMSNETALLQLYGISQKASYTKLREQSVTALMAAAQRQSLTVDELEDRIVPDCGLDSSGQKLFDFGKRQFEFVLNHDLTPYVKDNKGKLRANLPKAGKRDDAALASMAIAEWKLLKKQLNAVMSTQVHRLEQAMITGRRWSVSDFRLRLVQHPLMTHLVQRLLWAAYNEKGNRTLLFRVAEDNTFSDGEDQTIHLDSCAQVGLIHPLEPELEISQAWIDIWMDYEIFSPFSQLDRTLYRPTTQEQETATITRFEGVSLPATVIVNTLEGQGWERNIDSNHHYKRFPSHNLMAVLDYEIGISWWSIRKSGDARIGSCYFLTIDGRDRTRQPLDLIDPILFSETLRQLALLAAGAENTT